MGGDGCVRRTGKAGRARRDMIGYEVRGAGREQGGRWDQRFGRGAGVAIKALSNMVQVSDCTMVEMRGAGGMAFCAREGHTLA